MSYSEETMLLASDVSDAVEEAFCTDGRLTMRGKNYWIEEMEEDGDPIILRRHEDGHRFEVEIEVFVKELT